MKSAMTPISTISIVEDLRAMGVQKADTLVIRADLGAIGRIKRQDLLEGLLEAVGTEGTVLALAFTGSSFIKPANPNESFSPLSRSYAGGLPNTMLSDPRARRSEHPICSFVAIGAKAEWLLQGHGPHSSCYEPIRRVVQDGGKMLLVGCVKSSPGFTTAHLAEYDLGLHHRIIMPWLSSTYYTDAKGKKHLFRVRDSGLCSKSFVKFYGLHVEQGILRTGQVGNAYSVIVPAAKSYEVERAMLVTNPRFNVCDSPTCFLCNARRWDRVHHIPFYLARNIKKIYNKLFGESRQKSP